MEQGRSGVIGPKVTGLITKNQLYHWRRSQNAGLGD